MGWLTEQVSEDDMRVNATSPRGDPNGIFIGMKIWKRTGVSDGKMHALMHLMAEEEWYANGHAYLVTGNEELARQCYADRFACGFQEPIRTNENFAHNVFQIEGKYFYEIQNSFPRLQETSVDEGWYLFDYAAGLTAEEEIARELFVLYDWPGDGAYLVDWSEIYRNGVIMDYFERPPARHLKYTQVLTWEEFLEKNLGSGTGNTWVDISTQIKYYWLE